MIETQAQSIRKEIADDYSEHDPLELTNLAMERNRGPSFRTIGEVASGPFCIGAVVFATALSFT